MAPDTYTPARRYLVAQLLFIMQCILEDAGAGTEACGFRYLGNLLIQLGLCDAAYVLFETEEEMQHAYHQTVGPNGLSTNPYRGPFRIYAVACDAQGELVGENC